MLESIILGAIQGIAEWLPISSEGAIVLVKNNFFGGGALSDTIQLALFLHLGTFFAALVYFRHDVASLLKALVRYRVSSGPDRRLLRFLILATLVSAVLGGILFWLIGRIESDSAFTGRAVTAAVGALLLVTAYLQLKAGKEGERELGEKIRTDGILLGVVQGLAVLPGLSRSGLTVAALLLRKFRDTEALRLSFLMSLPMVLAGNIVLNLGDFSITPALLAGLLASFVFGLLTIDILLKLARKIQFGYFVLVFGILTIAAALL